MAWEVVTRNLRLAVHQGALVIVRHLQLPGHWECCTRPVLDWVSEHLNQASVNLMNGQYFPAFKAYLHAELSRPLSIEERKRGLNYAKKIGLRLVS